MTELHSKTRCNGQCCKCFVLPFSRQELLGRAIEAQDKLDERSTASQLQYAHDIAMVASMVRPVVGESPLPQHKGKWFTAIGEALNAPEPDYARDLEATPAKDEKVCPHCGPQRKLRLLIQVSRLNDPS